MNHVFDGVQIPMGRHNVEWKAHVPSYVRRQSAVSCAKTDGPVEMLFRLWARLSSGNHVLDGGPDPPCEGAIFRGKEHA